MSFASKFRARLEVQGQKPDRSRFTSGTSVDLFLRVISFEAPISIARTLVNNGLSVKAAKIAIDALAKDGETTVSLKLQEQDRKALFDELQALGVSTHRIESPDNIDVRAIRTAMGITRREFARRFAIDERTVEAWEQGKAKPAKPARTLLAVIQASPDVVTAALTARP